MLPKEKIQRVAIPIILSMMVVTMVTGCDGAEPVAEVAVTHAPVGESDEAHQPLSKVMEIDGFTLQANVTRTDFLHDAMAEQYDIDPDPDYVMLKLVILENRSDNRPEPVSAEVGAEYKNTIGQIETIAMRSVEADGYISYIGTLDAGSQRTFNLSIEAQPAGTDEPLHMDFEVELDW